jgi:hypothetical protein
VSSSNVVKTYDGTLAANGSAIVTSGALYHNASNGNAQDTLSGGSFAFTDKNAGSGNKNVSVSGVTVSDGNGGHNYVVTYANNTTSTINPATLSFNGTIASREYDGTTTATVSGYTLSGLIGSETLNVVYGNAAFVDKNAGSGKAVTINAIELSNGTNGGLASNYTINPTAPAVGTITPRMLTLNAVVDDKVYDGTTNATLHTFGLSGFIGSETVNASYTGTASFADRHVGDNKNITVTGIDLADGTNGGLASNYAVPSSAHSTASITPATLHIAGVVALDRVYDGTTTVHLNTDAATVTGLFGSDEVQISDITGTFLDKNVGTNKTIGAGDVILSGADAGDYVLVQPTGLTASITPRSLVVTAAGVNRVYDGTTNATVQLSDNRITGDSLSVTADSSFMDKNAGSGKFVNVTDIAISGADAGNYSVNSSTGTFANITRANLSVNITGVNRVYDGTTHATVSLSSTPLNGDDVQLQYVSANFADKNVGTGKSVSVSGINALGADAGNYAIGSTGTTTANITPATLTVTATGGVKTFDGSAIAPVTFTDNRIAGDDLTVVATNAAYADPNVGTGKPVSIQGIVIAGGADAGNYVLANTSTSTSGSILGQTSVAETWALPPTIPTPVPPTTPTTPPVVVDTSLPMIGGGGTGGNGGTGGTENSGFTNGGNGGTGSNGGFIGGNGGTGGGTNTSTGGSNGGVGGNGGTGGTGNSGFANGGTGNSGFINGGNGGAGGTGGTNTNTGGNNGGVGGQGGNGGFGGDIGSNGGTGGIGATNTNTGGNNGGVGGNGGTNGNGGSGGIGATGAIIPISGGIGGNGGDGGNGGTNGNTSTGVGGDGGNGGVGGASGTNANAGGNTGGNGGTHSDANTGSNGGAGGNGGSNAGGADTNASMNEAGGPGGNATNAQGGKGGTGGSASVGSTQSGSSNGANSADASSGANAVNGGSDSNSGNAQNGQSTGGSGGSNAAGSNSTGGDGANSANASSGSQSGENGTGSANAANEGSNNASEGNSSDSSATTSDSSNGGMSVSAHGADEHVVVSVVRTPLGDYPGLVTVQVPHKMAASSNGFSFALPAAMLDGGKVKITRADGKRLPKWLKYDATTHTVIATSPPANALPIELLVRVGEKRWTMVVSEQR